MCVIVVKNPGVELPTLKTLKECWTTNPDGAGILWQDSNGAIRGHKGFMTWKAFKAAWQAHNFTPDHAVIIHFRIATAGGIRPENCHPFPVASRNNKLQALEFSTDLAVAHNGVLGAGQGNLSDTMLFIKHELHLMRQDIYKQDDLALDIVNDALGYNNRLAILGKGFAQPVLLGDGWQMIDGIWYSNLNWQFLQIGYARASKCASKRSCFSRRSRYELIGGDCANPATYGLLSEYEESLDYEDYEDYEGSDTKELGSATSWVCCPQCNGWIYVDPSDGYLSCDCGYYDKLNLNEDNQSKSLCKYGLDKSCLDCDDAPYCQD